jgi:hypothetical protein
MFILFQKFLCCITTLEWLKLHIYKYLETWDVLKIYPEKSLCFNMDNYVTIIYLYFSLGTAIKILNFMQSP